MKKKNDSKQGKLKKLDELEKISQEIVDVLVSHKITIGDTMLIFGKIMHAIDSKLQHESKLSKGKIED